MLQQCLVSLSSIELPQGVEVDIVVVDNDATPSSHAVVEQYQTQSHFPVYYVHEPKRGIPIARNRALIESLQLDSDYVVFIDDDEWVESAWLVNLYDYCQARGGKVVVSGAVISELPESTPDHMRALFGKQKRKTGEKLGACATNNVIIPRYVYDEWGVRFDESNPLAGGTDTIYFVQAVARGVEIYKCNEAIVHEHIPASRTHLSWFAKRKYRAGVTDAWRKRQKGRAWVAILLSALGQAIIYSLLTLIYILLTNKHKRNKAWLKACRAAGVLAGLVGVQVQSYRKIAH